MSRPTREESIYQVSIHCNGGYMYASTHPYTTDEKTGKRKYVNLHWGYRFHLYIHEQGIVLVTADGPNHWHLRAEPSVF